MSDRTAMTEPLTLGQRIVAKWEGPASDWSEPADLADGIDAAIDAAVKEERMRCAYVIATEFQEAGDTEFDLGFETARKVFAAAILNPNK